MSSHVHLINHYCQMRQKSSGVLDPNDRNSLHTSAGDFHHHSRYTLKCMKYKHTKAKLISMAYV